MQDLKNKEEKQEEQLPLDLDLFFSFANLDELPETFFSKLPQYCDKILANLADIADVEEPEYTIEDEVKELCIRTVNQAYLSTHALYRADVEPLSHMPSFEQYENIVTDDFFYI